MKKSMELSITNNQIMLELDILKKEGIFSMTMLHF
jgi:hypothetical protein